MSTVNRRFPNVVIRASAGTGKTFQLSNRFIGLAAAGEPLDTILATTFTRKAAGEILDRVLTRLAEAALDSKKLDELARHVGDPSLDRARCLDILHNLLRQLHRIRVGTLDHFFIQIARSFSLDLGLPPGWRIVDETVDHRLRAEAIRRVLEDKPTQDTVRLMHLLTKGEASRSVSRQIASLVDELYSDYLEAPAGAWESLPRRKQLTEPELEAARNALADVAMPEDKRFFKAHSKDWERIEAEQWEDFVQNGLAAKIADGSNRYYGKRIQPDVVAAYEPFIKHAKAVLIGRIANQTEATHNLLARFDEAYEQLKFAERAMRFEDVTRKLGQAAVADRLDDVVYRLDAHLSHLLLDEFQDTAPSQWRVLRPFARRVVGHPVGHLAGRSFFCVGDLKQAIYGWRGGVAEIFEAIGEELDDLRSEVLSESYRSCSAVIDTVNRVFEGIATNAVLQHWPDAAAKWAERFDRHTTARTDLLGYCEMVTAPEPGEDEDRHEQTVQLAADRIGRLYRDLPDYGIGVLVRKNATVARLIYELRHRGIPASEEGGNPLTDSPAVQVLLSLLRLADHPGDTAARFHLAGSPLAGRIVPGRYDDTAAARRLSWSVRRSLLADGYGPTLYAWTKLLAPACDARDLNRLVQLVELAYAYEAGATGRTDDFAQLVSRQRVEDPTTARVRVMTFHQAKGLQFDVVVLPELDTQLSGMAPQLVVGREGPTKPIQRVCRHVAKDIRPMLPKTFQRMFDQHECRVIEESLCVLYVAITRAKHALHVIIAPSRPNERNLPGTAAGVLRAALTDGAKAPPETVLYRHGDPAWFDAMARKPAVAEAPPAAEQPLVPQLAESPGQPSRGLDRQSPSQLEGGARVDLAARMRLDTAEALLRGTLVHAWFEQIEWLEDGPPDDDVLRRVADALDIGSLDVDSLIHRFRAALGRPAVRAALSRSTYRQAAGDAETTPVHAGSDVSDPQWKVWREKTFALRDGDAILTGAIDRLVVLHDGVPHGGNRPIGADVLDFKTDAVAADDPRAIDQRVEVYRPQLEAYRRAVAAMLRLDPAQISTRLLFVEADTVRTV